MDTYYFSLVLQDSIESISLIAENESIKSGQLLVTKLQREVPTIMSTSHSFDCHSNESYLYLHFTGKVKSLDPNLIDSKNGEIWKCIFSHSALTVFHEDSDKDEKQMTVYYRSEPESYVNSLRELARKL
ncbi:hypothetical protein [Paenibacillus puerhi]|uniref:hypothetical protein n=1 Tax=Paenibacillus puerhi TaxID=2692622 RepID=UPI00135A340F|nr:hypothetical protein [Paenibacillus puerhi]